MGEGGQYIVASRSVGGSTLFDWFGPAQPDSEEEHPEIQLNNSNKESCFSP
jgi:hypothetical protein